jgi:hypothetical protein
MDMEYKIVTPPALWQDYNPMKQPLEVTVLNIELRDNLIIKDVFFTAETVADGKVRAYAKLFLQQNAEKAPTIIYVPTGGKVQHEGIFSETIFKKGYNMVMVDYGGKSDKKERATEYPDSLSYCVYDANKDNIYQPTPVENSPWLMWMKVIRRAITLVEDEPLVDENKIYLLGYLEGALLAWNVAGIDARIKAVIPVGGSGYVECLNRPKYSGEPPVEMTELWDCWLAGMSTQAYARMVMCPVLYMAGTNSTFADIDRINDLFALVPSGRKFLSFSAGTNHNISRANFEGAVTWLKKVSNGTLGTESPKLETYVSAGKLYASIHEVGSFEKIQIYYSIDEVNPAFRSWQQANAPLKVGKHDYISQLKVYKDSKRLFVYATVTYKNGLVLSTPEVALDVPKLELGEFDVNSETKSRFIYVPAMTEQPFSVETEYPVVDDKFLIVQKGPFGIKGVGVLDGKLCTNHIDPPDDRRDGDFLLQMDVYSKVAKEIKITLYTAEGGISKYGTTLKLLGSAKWQRINLTRADFKTSNMLQIKDWELVRKMKILKANDVLFTNILWV